jgi:hypothetical protein
MYICSSPSITPGLITRCIIRWLFIICHTVFHLTGGGNQQSVDTVSKLEDQNVTSCGLVDRDQCFGKPQFFHLQDIHSTAYTETSLPTKLREVTWLKAVMCSCFPKHVFPDMSSFRCFVSVPVGCRLTAITVSTIQMWPSNAHLHCWRYFVFCISVVNRFVITI